MSADVEYGYLELPYLQYSYLDAIRTHAVWTQVDRRIDTTHAAKAQTARTIADRPHADGAQVYRFIGGTHAAKTQVDRQIGSTHDAKVQIDRRLDKTHADGVQVDRKTSGLHAILAQTQRQIADDHSALEQVQRQIADTLHLARGQVNRVLGGASSHKRTEVRRGTVVHELCEDGGYLMLPYLEMPYLTGIICARMRTQIARRLDKLHAVNAQIERRLDKLHTIVAQIQRRIDKSHHDGAQIARRLDKLHQAKTQIQRRIDKRHTFFAQIQRRIDKSHTNGFQVDRIRANQKNAQITQVLYNIDNLRIVLDFPSRGSTVPGGINAWGNPTAQGENWVASSTFPGDFDVANVNTDIVEQCWRSAAGVKTSLELKCDTEVSQGVFLDTLAILNHNMTTSSNVVLQGANDSLFASVGFAETLTVTRGDMYYISPTLPNQGFRYWRLIINDPTNTAADVTGVQIGTIIFGSAIIFQGECFVDQVTLGRRHFADKVRTEGFTNVSNDRALKRVIGLEFRNLKFNRGNYPNIRTVFEQARTSLKCLWIPTPRYPTRFAVFGKLADLPNEQHNVKGEDLDFVSFSTQVDESL